jgi:pyruvate formate lyase activating enzyme
MGKSVSRAAVKIGYLQKTSFIEYPGRISAVVFTQGCNFRCPYCHNPELVEPARFSPALEIDTILSYLRTRKGKLDALSITGGEPCLQPGLLSFMKTVKDMGFLVKLDTNGSFPDVVSKAIGSGVVDFVAMDVKAPLSRYQEVAGCTLDPGAVAESIRIIRDSGVDCEFRTTLVEGLLDRNDLLEIGRLVEGVPRYALQRFVASKHLDESFFLARTLDETEIDGIVEALRPMVGKLIVR